MNYWYNFVSVHSVKPEYMETYLKEL